MSGNEWPTWKCAGLTAALCAVPLAIPFLAFPLATFAVWALLILAYLGLVRIFGTGFVVHGATIVLVLSVNFFLSAPKFLG